ncbi:methyl-accepting chemotaxis protein [Prosthecomicrobium sp. N25]|uniref:methyl-accepting chemotaxis protein n=1 Tax=Prosthecomicrobium sp. N25 TaxID=3129254 RepID=UPI0030776A37
MSLRLKIRHKIPLAVVGFALLVGMGVGAASYWTASAKVRTLTEERLTALAEERKGQLSDYLGAIEQDLTVLAANPSVSSALADFEKAFKAIPGDASAALKKTYIHDNPNPTGQKHKLDHGPARDGYDAVHARYHPWFRQLLEARGYYDIFLFDRDGNLVYTCFKEEDFSTNFASGKGGPWVDTDLGRAYRAALAGKTGSVHFFDFKAYAPSYDVPASFIATPVVVNGETVGVFAFQMPVDAINRIMSGTIGLGATGETLIVGSDRLLRNNSRFSAEDDILKTRVDNAAVGAALAGKPGVAETQDYRTLDLVQVAAPMTYHGTNWAIVAAQGIDEVEAPLAGMRNSMLLAALVLFAAAAAGGYLVALSLSRPISGLVGCMSALADGNLDVELKGADRHDEIGDMTRAVVVFQENAVERRRLEELAQGERQKEMMRQSHLETIIARFRSLIAGVLTKVDSETGTLRQSAKVVTGVAEQATRQAEDANRASAGASESVQAVAAATEELSASIREIAGQATRTSSVAGRASGVAGRTDAEVSALAEAAQRIGAVVEIIRAIADQTNLLALNATIEAARAGEAGRGFAIVAQEVKTLAGQTAQATNDIAAQIHGIQSSTRGTVDALAEITATIREIDHLTASIAAAVEQQDAATKEISKSVQRAADGSTVVAENVGRVSGAIAETNGEAIRVAAISDRLAEVARELSGAVEGFLVEVSRDVEDRRSTMRRPSSQKVTVRVGNADYETRILDESEAGLRIALVPGLKEGTPVSVRLPDGATFGATVIWTKQTSAGLRRTAELRRAA